MKKITVAKTSGFCFGVDRAIKIVNQQLDSNQKVATLGPIIHNTDVVNNLESKGVKTISSINDGLGYRVVIRSHGVPRSVYDELNEKKIEYIDATCPFVERIHKIVEEKSKEGYLILVAGDKNHPEVQGIVGFCTGEYYIFSDENELKEYFLKNLRINEKKVAIVAQTTYNIRMWEKCKLTAKDYCKSLQIYDTICNSTSNRQKEAAELAKKSDLMIIIGGKHSSNTIKLFNVCSQYCKCYHIENASELCSIDFNDSYSIGITAGASTPAYIIKEVEILMSENLKNQDEDFNFEEALEQSFKKIYKGNRVKAYITAVNSNEAVVDIGTKHTGYIPLSELTDDPSLTPSDIVKVGEEIDAIVTSISDQDGIVTLSKKKVDAMVGFETLIKAKEEGTILEGTVLSAIKGGILVSTNGTKVFIPASQASLRHDDKLQELVKKTVKFKIIEINEQRGGAVGSIKEVMKEQRAELQNKFWDTVKVGDKFKGAVKSITDFGVFVDLGGIDGMVHRTELSWKRIKHPSDVVSIGDVLEVYVKDLDREKNRISLGYRKQEDNPWQEFLKNYQVGSIVKATVVSITPFGAFAQIIPGVDGLIHISQIANQRVNKVSDVLSVGQEVEAKITEIDSDKQRISISMRAIAEDAPTEE